MICLSHCHTVDGRNPAAGAGFLPSTVSILYLIYVDNSGSLLCHSLVEEIFGNPPKNKEDSKIVNGGSWSTKRN